MLFSSRKRDRRINSVVVFLCSYIILIVCQLQQFTQLVSASETTHSDGKASRHPHQGFLRPYALVDPSLTEFDSKALDILQSGRPYKTKFVRNATSSAPAVTNDIVIQDISAPVNTVWDTVLNFDHYQDMAPELYNESQIYFKANEPNESTIHVRIKVGSQFYPSLIKKAAKYYVKYAVDPVNHLVTWTLDYNIRSDINDYVGYWYVIAHPDDPTQRTRIFYSIQVSFFALVPKVVVNRILSKATFLEDTVKWVKHHSEQLYEEQMIQQQQHEQEEEKHRNEKRNNDSWKSKLLPLLFNDRTNTNSSSAKASTGETITITNQQAEESGSSDDIVDCVVNDDGSTACENDFITTVVDPVVSTKQEDQQQERSAKKIGLKRYALVSSVLILSLYNVHLYFSQ